MIKKNYLNAIYRGKAENRYGFETAIHKSQISDNVYLSLKGLEGDQCADLDHHGGFERALHQYPLEHYSYWQKKYPNITNWGAPGMGENISSKGMTEETVYLGDRYLWGEAMIEVSQPRSPCFKLNHRWGLDDFSIDMQEVSRCGWLYRVIQPGIVSAKKPLELIQRDTNAMTLRQVCDIFFGDPLNQEGLLKLKQQKKLAESWASKVIERLQNNEVENWDFRLKGYESSE